MKKRLVLVISIKEENSEKSIFNKKKEKLGHLFVNYSRPTWEHWCDRHNVDFLVVDKLPKSLANSKIAGTYCRYFVDEILNNLELDYDQIAIVDSDMMVRWDAPNFFDQINGKLSAVLDNGYYEYVIQSIERIRDYFPQIQIDWLKYVNAGLLIINLKDEKQVKLFSLMRDFIEENLSIVNTPEFLSQITDQTLLNYFIQRDSLEVFNLSIAYNLMSAAEKNMFANGLFIKYSYIWHFNRSRDYYDEESRLQIMKQVWEKIAPCYNSNQFSYAEDLLNEVSAKKPKNVFRLKKGLLG